MTTPQEWQVTLDKVFPDGAIVRFLSPGDDWTDDDVIEVHIPRLVVVGSEGDAVAIRLHAMNHSKVAIPLIEEMHPYEEAPDGSTVMRMKRADDSDQVLIVRGDLQPAMVKALAEYRRWHPAEFVSEVLDEPPVENPPQEWGA